MLEIHEGSLTFRFPDQWRVTKFDDWGFIQNQFQRLGNNVRVACHRCNAELRCQNCSTAKTAGMKAVDILAITTDQCCWTIEAKDYRQDRRTKAIDLADEIALKVRDTLSGLIAARLNATIPDEAEAARAASNCIRMRIVLYLAQPHKHSKLFARVIRPADVQQRLRQLVRSVDPHPLVLEHGVPTGFDWTVT